jgi:CheY-like chemotaxis protein
MFNITVEVYGIFVALIARNIGNSSRNSIMPDDVRTILFVEDSEVEMISYRNMMERAGYCVQPAKDGLEAMRVLHNIVPDLVLLDLVLPRLDGVEVLKFIRSNPGLKAVPVIIFSTNSIMDAQDEPLLEGATKRLLKSQCTPPLMLLAIREVFANATKANTEAAASKAATKTPAKVNGKTATDASHELDTEHRTAAALAD